MTDAMAVSPRDINNRMLVTVPFRRIDGGFDAAIEYAAKIFAEHERCPRVEVHAYRDDGGLDYVCGLGRPERTAEFEEQGWTVAPLEGHTDMVRIDPSYAPDPRKKSTAADR